LGEVVALTITEPEVSTNGDRSARLHSATPKRRRPRRSVLERLTLNVVVGLVAALLAFVLTGVLLADRRETLTVAVAGEAIPAGAVITPEMVEGNELSANTGFAEDLVPMDRIRGGTLVASRTLQPGEPLTVAAVGSPGSTAGHRVMSIALEPWQAAGGEIEVGDQVDVIETTDEGPRYVLTAAAVVGRSSDEGSGGLVGGVQRGDLILSVEVDADEALALAGAIESGEVTVVRATGAPPAVPVPPPAEEAGG
jgi:Flp pilus assembly protein CpaB